MLAVAGCASPSMRPRAAAQPLATLQVAPAGNGAQVLALRMAAEFALQNDDAAAAARDYADAARLADDPAVAARAVQMALAAHDADAAAALIARWRQLGASKEDLANARARLALMQGDRAAAEQQFNVLLAPGKVDAWKTFAADLLVAPDAALAGAVLGDLATVGRLPANADLWVAISQLGEHLGQHAYARTLAQAAVRRFGNATSIRWAASLAWQRHDATAARQLYARGVAAHPRDASLRLGYAALLAQDKQYTTALRVLADGPQSADSWAARVGYALRANDAKALQSLYAQLVAQPAQAGGARPFLLGELAEGRKRDHAALGWYAQVDPDGAHGFDAMVRRAVLLDKAGQADAARALAAQLQDENADDPDAARTAYELGAQLYSRHGNHAAAIATYDRGLAVLQGDLVLRYDRGIEEASAGQTDAAIADFRRVLQDQPDNVEAMNALGFTLADAGRDLPEAEQLLGHAIAARPDSPEIMDSWGWLQYRLGHLDEARHWLERAWNSLNDPDVGVHLAEVLWKLGQHEHAWHVLAKVRTLDPRNAGLAKAEARLRP